jgi:hypothetical protein
LPKIEFRVGLICIWQFLKRSTLPEDASDLCKVPPEPDIGPEIKSSDIYFHLLRQAAAHPPPNDTLSD